MRNRIMGGIGVAWGGAIVLRWLLVGTRPGASPAYASGQSAAVVLGALMVLAGGYYLLKR